MMRKWIVGVVALLTMTVNAQVYLNPVSSIEERVEDLLSRMTLEEKVGQMTQADHTSLTEISDIKTYYLGSLLNGGGGSPADNSVAGWADMYDSYQQQAMSTRLAIPMIYGTDAVHGHNNLMGAVIFPHNIGLGCTRNYELIEEASRITAIEVAATGVDWTFAPCITVPRDERWGRTYEGFSEDPDLVRQCGAAAIRGFQGTDLKDSLTILGCAKHYTGDGGTTNGIDRGNTVLTEQELRDIHLAPYIDAINEGVSSVMASYNSWNGQKLHGHDYLLDTLLKGELGFDGFIVSDWAAIDEIPGDYLSDIEKSINAGIDMVMVPDRYLQFINGLIQLVNEGKVPMQRIDDANRRILKQKFKLGLFESPYTNRSFAQLVGSPEHRMVARQCVRESLVLLKNKNKILPLPKDAGHIHVAGKSSDDIGLQCGGWSISWQGSRGDITDGTTVLEAIQSVSSGTVSHSLYGYSEDADGAETAVVVIGEEPYAEGVGDRTDLSLSDEDVFILQDLYKRGFRIITIIISGRPMLLDDIWHYSDAIIAAWLPGTEALGITDVLFGDYQPKGKLSFTWPDNMDQLPINFGDSAYDPLFKLGYGIDTFAFPFVSDSPQALSAATDESGKYIEVCFDKPMMLPDISDLILHINGSINNIREINIKDSDTNTILIYPVANLDKSDVVNISSDGNLEARDGSMTGAFQLDVYNAMLNYSIIPGKIEAEDYASMSGIQTELCSDAGGGENVGYIDPGDFMTYYVSVSGNGLYNVQYRVASLANGGTFKLQLYEEGSYKDLHSVSFAATEGWQNWTTVEKSVTLSQGNHNIRLLATSAGFNINWFDIKDPGTSYLNSFADESQFKIYPNPVYGNKLYISAQSNDEILFEIYNAIGKEFFSGTFREEISVDVSGCKPGLYIIRLNTAESTILGKVIIK